MWLVVCKYVVCVGVFVVYACIWCGAVVEVCVCSVCGVWLGCVCMVWGMVRCVCVCVVSVCKCVVVGLWGCGWCVCVVCVGVVCLCVVSVCLCLGV